MILLFFFKSYLFFYATAIQPVSHALWKVTSEDGRAFLKKIMGSNFEKMLSLLIFIATIQCINTKTLDPISDAMFSNYDKSFRFQEASVRGLGPCECEVRIFFPSIVVAFSPLTLKTIIAVASQEHGRS